MIQMTAPDQVLVSGILQSGAVASIHLKGGTPAGRGSCSRSTAPRAPWRSCRPTLARRLTYRFQSSMCAVRSRANRYRISIPERYRWVPPATPAGLPFNVAQLYMRMAEGIREGRSVRPDFDVAVKRHQLPDAIQKASDTGSRQTLLAFDAKSPSLTTKKLDI